MNRTNILKFRIIPILVIILPIFFNNCKKTNTPTAEVKQGSVLKPVSLVATFTVGKPTADTKALKYGDLLESEPKIVVPNSSLLDLQVRNFATGITLRIKGGSEILLHRREKGDKKEFICFVKKGTVLFAINKLNKSESIIVYSPTSRSEVRGTLFKLSVKEDGSSSNIAVSEGSVEVAYSNPALESVYSSENIPEKTKTEIGKVLNNTVVIEAGKETTLAKTEIGKILEKDPELKALLDDPSLNNSPDPAQVVQNQELDKVLAEVETKMAQKELSEKKDINIAIVDSKEKDTIKKESSEIAAVDLTGKDQNEISKAVSDNINDKHSIYMKAVESTLGKNLETIKLANGRKVSGVIFMKGEYYHVNDPRGETLYKETEVDGFTFQ